MIPPVGHSPRAERTRKALIAAGRRLFSERAMDAVSVDDIVRAAKVGKGSFYNHFSDREGLLQVISGEIRGGIEQTIARANAGIDDPARRLARGSCAYLRFVLDEPERAGVLMRVQAGPATLDTSMNQGLIDDLRAGLRSGRFRVATLEGAALYVVGVVQIALIRVAKEPSPTLAAGLAEQICALLLGGLRVPEGEAQAIAVQAGDEIVRAGAHAVAFKPQETPA